MSRSDVINAIADHLIRLSLGHPVRVAIDGRTASGKTTLSDELAAAVSNRGRPVIRTSIDGFHRPKAERYARGRHSAEGYYFDARDLSAVTKLLLEPLGAGGNRLYRTASFDLDADVSIEQEPKLAEQDAILIVDGTFLQREELRAHWDRAIFVKTSAEVSESRGLRRDMDRLGGEAAAKELYATRYRPAFELYERLSQPENICDMIVDNDDLHSPHLRLPAGRQV